MQKGHSHEQPFIKLFFLVVFFLLKEHMQSYEMILRNANMIKKKLDFLSLQQYVFGEHFTSYGTPLMGGLSMMVM